MHDQCEHASVLLAGHMLLPLVPVPDEPQPRAPLACGQASVMLGTGGISAWHLWASMRCPMCDDSVMTTPGAMFT